LCDRPINSPSTTTERGFRIGHPPAIYSPRARFAWFCPDLSAGTGNEPVQSLDRSLFDTELEGDAETEVVVRVVGPVPVAVRRPAVPGVVVPTAATVHPVRATLARSPNHQASVFENATTLSAE